MHEPASELGGASPADCGASATCQTTRSLDSTSYARKPRAIVANGDLAGLPRAIEEAG